MIKVLMFDVDNTLLDFGKCSEMSIRKAFSEAGLPLDSNVLKVFPEINEILWNRVEEKTLTVEELWKIRWNIIFERLNIDYDGVKFEKIFHVYLSKSHVPMQGAKSLLETAKGKYRMFIASNAPKGQQEYRLSKENMLCCFERLFVSGDIGVFKPSKEFFDICIKSINVPKKEIMMIGDSYTADITGAYNAGIKTCWFNPSHKKIASDAKPDFEFSSLAEIEKFIAEDINI